MLFFLLYNKFCELLKIFATVSLFQNVHAASQLGHVNGGFHRNGSVRSAECHPLHAHGGGGGAEQGGGGGGHNHHTLDHSYKVTVPSILCRKEINSCLIDKFIVCCSLFYLLREFL